MSHGNFTPKQIAAGQRADALRGQVGKALGMSIPQGSRASLIVDMNAHSGKSYSPEEHAAAIRADHQAIQELGGKSSGSSSSKSGGGGQMGNPNHDAQGRFTGK